jgi:hypothetical protein
VIAVRPGIEVAETILRSETDPGDVEASRRGAGTVVGDQSETAAYMQVVSERYLLMRTHAWDTGVLERVARELR